MKVAILLLLAALAAGCKSGRDYRSVDRSSLEFLRDTHRQGKAIRKESLRETLAFSERAERNHRIRRESRAFAGEAAFDGQWEAAGSAWQSLREELRFSNKDIARNARFGFLDTGE
jgi:hypothetical protein